MDTLIDRYLTAVSDNLPAKQRKDTVTEIHSLIQDAMDERIKTEAREPDEEMMAEVLKQFGSPEAIVAPYLPEKYLVGPKLYPTLITVLRIVLPIIAVLSLVGFWIGHSQAASTLSVRLITNIVQSFGNSLAAVVQAFGNIVLIFAIIQWVLPEFKPKTQEWDPHSLKAVRTPNKIKRGELITEIAFTLVGLIIVNFYTDWIGIYNNINGQWTFTPILTTGFKTFIPWLTGLWLLTIVLDILVLRKGAWQFGTRLFTILLSVFNIALAVSMMARLDYLYTLKGALGEAGSTGILQSLMNQILIVVFIIVIVLSAIKIIQMSWQLLKDKDPIDEKAAQ